MAALAQAEPRAKRPCPMAGTLNPLKCVTNLRGRYTEDTADVFFVDGETKERLPAHREVLKVASAVFFTMFDGNWMEKCKKEIPAPEEYEWESFKAAIALLYGEEVDVAHLLYETMEMLVQSEAVKSVEVVLVCLLSQWTKVHSGITLSQMKQLYSNIRFGTIQYKCLVECSVTGHDNLKLALENHWLFFLDCMRSSLPQITPRLAQKEVFQVFPMDRGVGIMAKKNGQAEVHLPGQQVTRKQQQHRGFIHERQSPPVGIVYCGRQEIRFQVDLKTEASFRMDLQCQLIGLRNLHSDSFASSGLQTTQTCTHRLTHGEMRDNTSTITFVCCTVVLNRSGAHLMLQSACLPSSDARAFKKMNLPSPGDSPWVLTFAWKSNDPCATGPLVLTIHPPTL